MMEVITYIPFDFILLLLGMFAALVVLVLIYHFYKAARRQRLTSPRKEYIYRQKT